MQRITYYVEVGVVVWVEVVDEVCRSKCLDVFCVVEKKMFELGDEQGLYILVI